MRGVSSGVTGEQGTGTTADPNVAVYLDEQSGALPGRNLDVYAADLERIEVLEGPQGTLFARAPRRACCATSQQAQTRRDGRQRQCGLQLHGHGDPIAASMR